MSEEREDDYGLDKASRNTADRAAEAADVAPPLDPPFPYRALPMPIELFLEDL